MNVHEIMEHLLEIFLLEPELDNLMHTGIAKNSSMSHFIDLVDHKS